MPTRYYISLPDPARARGTDAGLAFRAQGAEAFAAELQEALRSDGLFERWRAQQDDPDAVDPALGATDADAVIVRSRSRSCAASSARSSRSSAASPLQTSWMCDSRGAAASGDSSSNSARRRCQSASSEAVVTSPKIASATRMGYAAVLSDA